MALVILCLLLVVAPGAAPSEAGAPAGSLRGSVRGAQGKPVNGAAVKIHNRDRGITVTVFSRHGNYATWELVTGKSEVSAALPGSSSSESAEISRDRAFTKSLWARPFQS